MKHLLLTTIAVVLLIGCGPLQSNAMSLHRAAEEGDIEAVKKHLAAGANKNVRAGKWRDTPLHRAAFWGYTEIVELLINNEVDVNAKLELNEPSTEWDWSTPLHWAIIGRADGVTTDKETAKLLIAKDADVNTLTNKGDAPLDFAVKYKQTEIADLLRKHGGKTAEELKAAGK